MPGDHRAAKLRSYRKTRWEARPRAEWVGRPKIRGGGAAPTHEPFPTASVGWAKAIRPCPRGSDELSMNRMRQPAPCPRGHAALCPPYVTPTPSSFRRKPESRVVRDWTPAFAGVTINGAGVTIRPCIPWSDNSIYAGSHRTNHFHRTSRSHQGRRPHARRVGGLTSPRIRATPSPGSPRGRKRLRRRKRSAAVMPRGRQGDRMSLQPSASRMQRCRPT